MIQSWMTWKFRLNLILMASMISMLKSAEVKQIDDISAEVEDEKNVES